MNDFNITIEKFIFHFTSYPKLITFKREYQINSNLKLREFFSEHIRKVIRDPIKKAARFKDLQVTVGYWTTRILSEDSYFVEGSQHIAEQLYTSTASDSRIAKGNLAVILFRDDECQDPQPQLALLKFDPSIAVISKPNRAADDVAFDVIEDSLPTPRENLQKAAILQSLKTENRQYLDLYMVDRQSEKDNVANFFRVDFLGVDETLDKIKRTERFYDALLEAGNTLKENGKILPEEADGFQILAYDALALSKIEVVSWLEKQDFAYITDDPDKRNIIRQEIRKTLNKKQLNDPEIEIDRDTAEGILFADSIFLVPRAFKLYVSKKLMTDKAVQLNVVYNGQPGIFIRTEPSKVKQMSKK